MDLGTNGLRFGIYDAEEDGRWHRIEKGRVALGLGFEVFRTGRLSRAALGRTTEAMAIFGRRARVLRVGKVLAVGTSALREASNGKAFVRRLEAKTGLRVRIISGALEARFIATGVLAGGKAKRGRVILADIGGGSTELSLAVAGKARRSLSLRLGSARLQTLFLGGASASNAPPPAAVSRLRSHVRRVLTRSLPRRTWPQTSRLIGSSGTIRALCRIHEAETGRKSPNRRWLEDFVGRIVEKNHRKLLDIPGLDARRVETILAGSILLEEILDYLGVRRFSPSSRGLRDGLLQVETARLSRLPSSSS